MFDDGFDNEVVEDFVNDFELFDLDEELEGILKGDRPHNYDVLAVASYEPDISLRAPLHLLVGWSPELTQRYDRVVIEGDVFQGYVLEGKKIQPVSSTSPVDLEFEPTPFVRFPANPDISALLLASEFTREDLDDVRVYMPPENTVVSPGWIGDVDNHNLALAYKSERKLGSMFFKNYQG